VAEYRLYGMGESGNAYKAALMLNLCSLDWEPVFVDFFNGEGRTEQYRSDINEFGEIPVLEHDGQRLTQSGVILHYLAEKAGRFGPANAEEAQEIWRWILFDNHKFTANMATLRFLRCFAPNPVDPAVLAFMRGRVNASYAIGEKHLQSRPFILGAEPTIADISMAGYIFYPPGETGLDLATEFPALDAWRQRIAGLQNWRGPYELMPRAWNGAAT
jgi:glutathione S-transferase